MDYDIIGDIHGQAEKLKALLKILGYRVKDGAYRHPQGRTAAFLGDLIDRGPGQLEVVDIVRRMLDAGSARAVLGNHEWNAIGWGTPRPNGEAFLKARGPNMASQHGEFLRQVGMDSAKHREILGWMRTLPPCLNLDGIRLCHAWWNPESVSELQNRTGTDGILSEADLNASYRKDNPIWQAMEAVTKGHEIALPPGVSFLDHNETARTEIRVRWWDASATTYQEAALVPERERPRIPNLPLPEGLQLGAVSDVPTFVGHYWFTGQPTVLGPKMACLDYSAGKNGPLVAYRYDGEDELANEKLIAVGLSSPGA